MNGFQLAESNIRVRVQPGTQCAKMCCIFYESANYFNQNRVVPNECCNKPFDHRESAMLGLELVVCAW